MTNEFQQEFIEEAKQVLKHLEHSLIQLERSASPEEINNTYRFLHTLKGGAGMFGFHTAERLAHELESVYSDVRDGLRQHDEFILDLALHTVDVLVDLIEGKGDDKEAEKIIQSINGLKNEGSTSHSPSHDKTPTHKLECFAILLRPDKEIFKRGINLAALLEEVQELGASELIIHNEIIPFEKQLTQKQIVSWFEILLAVQSGVDSIQDVFMFMKDQEYKIIPIQNSTSFQESAYQEVIQLTDADVDKRLAIMQQLAPGLLKSAFDSQASPIESKNSHIDSVDETFQQVEETTVISRSKKASHVSVATQKLDQLINIVSELVIFRSEISHLMSSHQNPAVVEALEKLERLTLGLRDSAFNIRLVPLNILNVKLQRLIRSVSKELGKEIDFITEGLDTELDRSMISSLEAPLMHIIRNAIDHGIESPEDRENNNKPRKGLVKLYSYNSGDHVFIQVQDDGRGLDFEKIRAKGIEKGLLNKNQSYTEKELINLMMTPGFSTAEKITTVSGRGVGMDVVKRDIASMRGDIEVSTEKGLGSIFTLRLPLTLTVLDTLVVEVADNKYLIPINEVEHCYKEKHTNLFKKTSRQINYQGQLTPFVSLREHFNVQDYRDEETVIVVNKNDTRIAIVVDGIIGKLQTVYKPLNDLLPVDCFSGSSILGDGSMALILNALKLKN
jgi:two-component system, chemotaxis family, sensor kinase CheA